ncbi:hypothetical protein FQZ97_876780 [compost metagenome]
MAAQVQGQVQRTEGRLHHTRLLEQAREITERASGFHQGDDWHLTTQQVMHETDVGGGFCLGQHQGVDTGIAQRSQISLELFGASRIDAHDDRHPVDSVIGNGLAGGITGSGRHGVLEIKDDSIRPAGSGLGKALRAVTGNEQRRQRWTKKRTQHVALASMLILPSPSWVQACRLSPLSCHEAAARNGRPAINGAWPR